MEEICRECGAKLDYQQANSSSQAKMLVTVCCFNLKCLRSLIFDKQG